MRKISAFVFSICLVLSLSTCKPFLANLEEDLSYLTSIATIEKAVLDNLVKDNEQIPCLSSNGDKSIIIKLDNPKNYTLKMPGKEGSPSDIVIFEDGVKGSKGEKPEVNSDYTLESLDFKTLKLTFKKAFLKQNEYGSVNIAPQKFNLYNKEGRIFPQKYTFKLRANTPPPALNFKAVGKTQGADGNWYYVLCFEVKDEDINKTVSAGLLHGDIEKITITPQGGTPRDIPLTVNANGFDISKSDGHLLPADKVEKLQTTDITTGSTPDTLPTGKWVLRFKTDVEVKGAAKEYTFKLLDQKGLSSAEVKAGTNTTKLPAVELYNGTIHINATAESNAHPISLGSSATVTLTAKAQTGAAIKGTVEKKVGTNRTKISDVSGTTTASITLPALDASENEAIYKISLKARAAGYADSDEKAFFVKVKKASTINSSDPFAWKKLKEAVQAADEGDIFIIDGTIQSTTAPGNSGEIIIDKDLTIQGKTGAASDILDANESAFSATEDKHRIFRVKDGKTLTLKNLTLKNGYAGKSTVDNLGTTGGGIRLESGTVSLSGVTISECKARTTPASVGIGSWHGDGAGIYVVSGTIIMENTTLSANDASAHGGAVYLNGGTLTMKGSSVITPSTISNANKTGKNDVHLKNGAKINVDDALTGTAPVARIKVAYNEYLPTRQVLDGTAAASHNTKFIVTDQDLGTDNGGVHVRKWNIKSDGYLQSEEVTLDGSEIRAWQALKDAVRTASDGDVIAINGTIQATNAGSGEYVDNGEIVIDKNLTIKKADTAATAVLDANKDAGSKPKHRIFKVEAGKTLSLQNLTLTGGVAEGTGEAGFGGGVYANGGTVNITNCTVKDNSAKDGGGICVKGAGATLTMSGGKISANKAVTDPSAPNGQKGGAGGGILIGTGAKLTISGGTVGGSSDAEGNSAAIGGGIYMMDNGAEAEMTGGSITHNKAGKSGGGVYISDYNSNPRSLFTLKGGTVSYNTAKNGGGITAFGDFNMDGGSIEENTATGDPDPSLNLGTGGGIDLVAATMNMTGGEIKNNHAKRSGGGVSIALSGASNSVLNMSGGTISGNTLTNSAGTGKGVGFFTGSTTHGSTTYYTIMKMSGSAKVDVDNDVYLTSKDDHSNEIRMITVDGELTGTAPVACITPKNYSAGLRVLEAGTGVNLASEAGKFTVTPQTAPAKKWTIDEQGNLQEITGGSASSATAKWTALKNAVETNTTPDAVFYIEGEYTMSSGTDTIASAVSYTTIRSTNNAVLNGDSKGTMIYIDYSRNITLENLKIQNGKNDSFALSASFGSEVYLKNVTVSNTKKIVKSNSGDVTFENVEALDTDSVIELGGGNSGSSKVEYSYLKIKGDTNFKGTVKLSFPYNLHDYSSAVKICDKKSYTLKLDFDGYYDKAENQQVVFLDDSVTDFTLADAVKNITVKENGGFQWYIDDNGYLKKRS